MIEVVTDEKWKKPIGDYVKKHAHIHHEVNDWYSYLGFVEDDELLGGFLFSDWDGYNIWIHLALKTPRCCTRRNIQYVFKYCFNQIKCGRITAMCINGYERNEKLLKGTGFVKEGIIRKAMKVNGKFIDGALYGMLKEECRWV